METWWAGTSGGALASRGGASAILTWLPWRKQEKLLGVQAQQPAELLGVGLRVRGHNGYDITSSITTWKSHQICGNDVGRTKGLRGRGGCRGGWRD